ncbi:hypothetical protein ACWEN6_04635 [Sphaerisporangium sp. NPDC004334]
MLHGIGDEFADQQFDIVDALTPSREKYSAHVHPRDRDRTGAAEKSKDEAPRSPVDPSASEPAAPAPADHA